MDDNLDLELNNESLKLQNKEYGDRLNILESFIADSNKIDTGVKEKLIELIKTYQDIDPKVVGELKGAMNSIVTNQQSTGAFKLAKIVENLLKEKYMDNPAFDNYSERRNKRYITFEDLLNFARSVGDIDSDQFHFAKGLKEIRNEEGHELNVQKGKGWLQSAFLIGIGLILKLSGHQIN